jgi:hypothetical protein
LKTRRARPPSLPGTSLQRLLSITRGRSIGRHTERYKKVRAKDQWHLDPRWPLKVLSHTLAVYLCRQAGLSPPCFAGSVVD